MNRGVGIGLCQCKRAVVAIEASKVGLVVFEAVLAIAIVPLRSISADASFLSLRRRWRVVSRSRLDSEAG